MSSAVCSGCSSHGGCQVTSETKFVSARKFSAMDFARRFGGFRIRRLDGDDEFARVGEMLLVNFQSLDGGNIRRQQIENFDVKMQSRESERQSESAAKATTSGTISWEKFALQSFAGARIFQSPRICRHVFELPVAVQIFAEQRARQLKPGEAIWRRAASVPGIFVRAKFNLPLVAGHLRGRQRKWNFGKLDEEISIHIRRQQQIAGEFGAAGRRFPNRLTLLDAPAGRGKIGGRQWRRGAATGGKECSSRKVTRNAPYFICEVHACRRIFVHNDDADGN